MSEPKMVIVVRKDLLANKDQSVLLEQLVAAPALLE